MLVISDGPERIRELFAQVELGAEFECRDCMPYESSTSVLDRAPAADSDGGAVASAEKLQLTGFQTALGSL